MFFKPYSTVSIANFEHVIPSWVMYSNKEQGNTCSKF